MSEKMTSQNELTEFKSVPYNKPLATPYGYFDENFGKPGQTLLIFTPTTQLPRCAQP